MRVRDYVLTREQMREWVTSEEARSRLRGLARKATKVARRNVDPATTRILSPSLEALEEVRQ